MWAMTDAEAVLFIMTVCLQCVSPLSRGAGAMPFWRQT
jgi:hypothetical protein